MSTPVLIDDRAGSKELVKYPPLDDIGELCRLDSGDAMIVGNGPDGDLLVGVEVKSIRDFISSASTGRLQGTQVPAMLEEFDVNWILYHGLYRPSPRDGRLQLLQGGSWRGHRIGKNVVPYGYVEGMLFDLAALGFNVKHVASPKEAAFWIGCLYRWWSKPWDKHKGMKKFDNSRTVSLMPGLPDNVYNRAKIASQLPGLGYERAVAAAKHFNSVEDMITAPSGEWEKVPGVGAIIAQGIRRAVT